ncbi:Anaphase-promoting complex subunit 1 [Hypsibius exemplaris]|uniref:Anaphase-promoting complex subunit 1 n=1 Tax=Hypsibius exemplaris TaxID=2072580 RepID=A0A1W0WMD3_HYPEX|nr:Anaphase-promoting complex subunit 1 [Hypsibius exemplaris]
MISIVNGPVLNFDQLIEANIPGAHDPPPSQDSSWAKTRLFSFPVRLSFGDLDHHSSGRGAAARQSSNQSTDAAAKRISPTAKVPQLGKYDLLILRELYCHADGSDRNSCVLDDATAEESRTNFGGRIPLPRRPHGETAAHRVKVRTTARSDGKVDGDEFVIMAGSVVLHGRGVEGSYYVVEEVHRKDHPIVDSAWCSFRHCDRHVPPEFAAITPTLEPFEPVDALCIAEQRKLHIHRDNGEQYSHASSFPIRRLWSFPLGLLVERDTGVASNLTNIMGYPNLFSATTHFEELAPVLFLGNARHADELSVLLHTDCVVAGVSDTLPLVLLFEPHANAHSLWLARLTTPEEMDAAVELIQKEHPQDGETLHFHGNCESPRHRSRTRSAPLFIAGSPIESFRSSPIITPPTRSLLPNESAKKTHSLHRDVLLASGRKFPHPGISSTPSSASSTYGSPAAPMQTLGETPEASGSGMRPHGSSGGGLNVSLASSAVVSINMSMSLSSKSSVGLSQMNPSSLGSPNAPASTLRDIRAPVMSFIQSKISSLPSEKNRPESDAVPHGLSRRARSDSIYHHSHQRYAKKFTRTTHPCPSTQPITDELAFPKLTFVHVWTDFTGASTSRHKPSQSSFQFQDCFQRAHFCFIASGQQELRCVRLRQEFLNDGEHVRISADTVTGIPAISAVKLSDRNLMVVLQPSHELKIYAAPTLPLLTIDLTSTSPVEFGIHSRHFHHLGTVGPTTSSPQLPKGSSQLVSSPHLSPVVENTNAPVSSVSKRIQFLTPCSGNKFLAETAEGSRLIRIPERLSSEVIDLCLDALREHIDSDLFGRILAEWTKLSCDLTTRRNGTLQDRWNKFFTALLAKLACSVVPAAPLDGRQSGTSVWETMNARVESNADGFRIIVDRNVPYATYTPAVLMTLHLVAEEVRLCSVWQPELQCLWPWMKALGDICERSEWSRYYETLLLDREATLPINVLFNGARRPAGRGKRLPTEPPCLISALEETLRGKSPKYPVAVCVNPLSRKFVKLMTAVAGFRSEGTTTEDGLKLIITVLQKEQFSEDDYRLLPKTLQIAVQAVFSGLCEISVFEKLPPLMFMIAGRADAVKCKDIVEGRCAGDFCLVDAHRKFLPKTPEGHDSDASKKKAPPLPRSLVTKRFANDARVREAERLLVTSDPVVIPLNAMHSSNEVEFRRSQEAWLKSVATRTMALPVARGMLSLGSEYAYATEKLTAPDMVYAGVERGNTRNVTLKNEDIPGGYENWPRFHNGVSTGLRLRHYRTDSVKFDHHWLAFNASQQTKRESVDYAGMFLGMALNHLIDSNTDPVELHNLLVRLEDPVSIAVILGMACVKRGSQDKRYYRMIGLHVISFIPDSGIELVIPQNIHVASLLSLGLLYRGSANRFISERLLAEIWSGSTADVNGEVSGKEGMTSERESTSLAAALGLGLVLLGLGNESVLGLADLAIPRRLKTLMNGGLHGKSNMLNKRTDGNVNGYSPPKARDMDEQSINTHITAPGSILALAMIFMKTERRDVAEWMAMPGTLHELDEIRPDFLLLRVVARSLIMWSSVEATEKWVNSNFPKWILKNVFLSTVELEKAGHDVISMTQAYLYILAGSCMSIGLKYAGTASILAKDFLLKICAMVNRWLEDAIIIRRCSQTLIQTCLTTVLIAAASVMAGTGDLDVFRVLRHMHGRPRGVITYGHQMGVHMAIGLLFLGCGMFTLGTSNEALAAMLIAFYPMWPKNANDNRYHLQAFRHLYVLAVENRLVTTRSIFDGSPVQTTVRVVFSGTEEEKILITPCVLPELTKLTSVSIASGRHWLIFNGSEDGWKSLTRLLTEEGIVVYPPAGNLRKEHLSLKTGLNAAGKDSLLAHLDRFMTHPVNGRPEIVASAKKFLWEYRLSCADRGAVGLFEIASRNWLDDGAGSDECGNRLRQAEKQWIAWVIYQCAVHEESDALMEILVASFDHDRGHWAHVVAMLQRSFAATGGGGGRRQPWKARLHKSNFEKAFFSLGSSV